MKIVIFLSFTLLLIGCRLVGFVFDSLVRIQNDSNYDLKIMAFKDGKILYSESRTDTLFLAKGKFVEIKQQPRRDSGIFFNLDTDSLVIKFDNKKKLIQYCNGLNLASLKEGSICNIKNNLFKITSANVENFKNGNYDKRTTYKITDNDYDRAVLYVK